MERIFEALLDRLNILASLMIVGLMLLIATDVIGRALFNLPVAGVPEIVKVTIVAIVWLQIAYALRSGSHLRSNMVFSALPRRVQQIIYGVNCLIGIIVFGLITWYTHDDVIKTFQHGIFEGEDPVRILVWPTWAALVLGAALTMVEYVIQFFKTIDSRRFGTINDISKSDTSNHDANERN